MASSFVVEDQSRGRTLVVTGTWSVEAEATLSDASIDGVWLNYARGFCEPNLSFVKEWPVRRLLVLDRTLTDLSPLGRLAETLEDLSIQAAPEASLDLGVLPNLRRLAAHWGAINASLHEPSGLSELVVFDYDETTLQPLTVQPSLERLTLKMAERLETLDGADALPTLTALSIAGAPHLEDISVLAATGPTLRELKFESCRALPDLDPIQSLHELRVLGLSDCGPLPSLGPLSGLSRLERLLAWGATRIEDGDLSPLLGLPALQEIRMRSRPTYSPPLTEIQQRLTSA